MVRFRSTSKKSFNEMISDRRGTHTSKHKIKSKNLITKRGLKSKISLIHNLNNLYTTSKSKVGVTKKKKLH